MKGYTCIHAIAKCKDCDWIDEDFMTAQKTAREHHKQNNHDVNIEIGYFKEYLKGTSKPSSTQLNNEGGKDEN